MKSAVSSVRLLERRATASISKLKRKRPILHSLTQRESGEKNQSARLLINLRLCARSAPLIEQMYACLYWMRFKAWAFKKSALPVRLKKKEKAASCYSTNGTLSKDSGWSI